MTPTPAATAATPRLAWMDCVKVLGMYLIIVGHMFPKGQEYVYGVSVPVFFWASGYLFRAKTWSTLLKGSIFNLYLPAMTLILIVKSMNWWILGQEDSFIDLLIGNIRSSLLGWHGFQKYGIGVGWFIYTLICLNLLNKLLGEKIFSLLCVPMALLAIWLNHCGLWYGNSILNVSVAIPFYVMGIWCRALSVKIDNLMRSTLLLVLILCVYFIDAHINGAPWMYLNQYGKYYLLFIIEGAAGIWVLAYVGHRLEHLLPSGMMQITTLLAEGALLVLCTHQFVIKHLYIGLSPWIFAALLYAAYVPAIWVCKKWCPFLIGKYGKGAKKRIGAIA